MRDINKYTYMTRAEFLNFISKSDNYLFCPKELELINYNKLCHCNEEIRMNCWEKSIKDIKFKGDNMAYKNEYIAMMRGDFLENKIKDIKSEDNMEKKDLKNGMIVEIRKGDKFLILSGRMVNKTEHVVCSHYNDDLTDNQNREYDIVKVYKCLPITLNDLFEDYNLELIWKRSEVAWSKIEVDDKMQCSVNGMDWVNCYFAGIKDGKVCFWLGGGTSFTTSKYTSSKYARSYKEGDKN